MATDDKTYIASTTAGKTWRLYTHKPEGRDPYAFAIEGEKGPGYFECVYGGPTGSRQVKLPLTGRLTAKAKANAMLALEAKLREMGAIE